MVQNIQTISDYRYLIGYTRNILNFWLNVFKITRFFEISKNIVFFLFHSLLFSKKELKTTKKNSIIFKITSIWRIIIGLLFFINIFYFENLHEPKQHILLLKEVAKVLKNQKNYPIVPILWLNDNKIICSIGFGCESESIDQGRSYVDKNINVSLCFFSRSLSYSGSGGVIYVNGGSYSMNICYSIFYNSVCSTLGGAIFFYSSNSCLRMICANSCFCGASSGRHFAWLQASLVNQLEYLSVSNCSHTTSGYYSIWLYTGNQRVDNTNSSLNNANQGSGIGINYPSSFTSSHCTFSNNKEFDRICIFFSSSSGATPMSYANIVHNNSPSWGVVYVSGGGSTNMLYCIFQNNQNCLFCVNDGSLEVSHSFIDHTGSFSTRTAVSTSTNNSFTHRITYQLHFFNSHHCHADMPLPYRTPDQTLAPTNTLEETPIKTLDGSPMNTVKETPYRSYDDSRGNKTYSVLLYSTVGLFIIIVVMISYSIGSQRNQNDISLSSSLEMEMKHKTGENSKKKKHDSQRDHQMNHHDSVNNPYAF